MTRIISNVQVQFPDLCHKVEQFKNTEVQVIWKNGLPEIRCRRVMLRPIQAGDLLVYQKLFNNAIAMQRYAGGVRDITNRFNNWLERWKEHSFSALAVVDLGTKKVIGHLVVGHGSYEGDLNKGWSEGAIVIDPAYWNADHKTHPTVGTADKKNIGSEVIRAGIAYVRSLKERSIPVPCDVTAEQRPQLEELLKTRKDLKVHRDAKGQIDWIYLPFTEVRATCHKENPGAYKTLERAIVREHGVKTPKTIERDLFVVNL